MSGAPLPLLSCSAGPAAFRACAAHDRRQGVCRTPLVCTQGIVNVIVPNVLPIYSMDPSDPGAGYHPNPPPELYESHSQSIMVQCSSALFDLIFVKLRFRKFVAFSSYNKSNEFGIEPDCTAALG